MTFQAVDCSSLDADLFLSTDVLVIGSGASGAVVAAELAEAGQQVTLLEEGAHHPSLGSMSRTEVLRHVWREGGTTIALGLGNTPSVNVMTGRAVGGSSLLTGGVCFRTPDRILDVWVREHGLHRLTPRSLEPCFEAVERALHVEEVPVAMRSRGTQLFDQGLQTLGFPALKPLRRNTDGCCGCSRCNFVCPHGAKLSVDRNYLPRAVAAGATIYAGALVDRIDTHGGRAIGASGRLLQAHHPSGRRFEVRARRVVLAAGGLHTPLLLLRSGLGRGLSQVGRNLTLHPGCRVFGRFDERVENWKGALQSAFTDHFEDEGMTLISLSVPPSVLAATAGGAGPRLHARLAAVPHVATFGGMLHDEAGGRVRRGFGREPWLTYRMAAADRARLPKLIRRMAQVFRAAGARELYLPILGMPAVKPERLESVDLEHVPARLIECASQHPLGSCRMGVSPARSVVDPEGKVWGVDELFVVDGSIVPTSLGVNPQESIMALATRLAWDLRERRYVD